MASILDRYGIKEVCDVTFYEITETGAMGRPVLYLDTLKVTTIEQTAEQVDARGGKGNPKLVTWDYGKEINVTIEDALFSAKSMAILFAGGDVTVNNSLGVSRVATIRVDASTGKLAPYFYVDLYDATEGGAKRTKVYNDNSTHSDGLNITTALGKMNTSAGLKLWPETGAAALVESASAADFTATYSDHKGEKVFFTYNVLSNARVFEVNADSFPGTYYMQGDTYARSDVTGKDSFFQFIIPKCKMQANETITLQAEGDPTTFNMNLTVLRPDDGVMIKMVQYDLIGG